MSQVDNKVVLLGASGVGKTCLCERYINNIYAEQKQTVGPSYFIKKELVNKKTITLGIWDTAGAERFECVTNIYYRKAGAAIICWDLFNRDSFYKLKFWVNQLRASEKDCLIYLVGCKEDLISARSPKAVSDQELKEFADSIKAKNTYQTSSVTGSNIDKLFHQIAIDWYQNNVNVNNNAPDSKINLEPTEQDNSCFC